MTKKPQAYRRYRDHVHLYYEGICHICGKHEPQPWSWLEVATMVFIFGFIAWAVFVILILAHWRGA